MLKFINRLKRLSKNIILRRFIKSIITIFVVVSLTFFIIRLMPSNPIQIYINQLISQYGMTYKEAEALAASLFSIDLKKPLILQYFDFLKNLFRGDLGISFLSRGTKVTSIIKEFLPWTLFSVGVSLLISFSLGIIIGMLIAYKRGSIIDVAITSIASILSSIPNYLIGIMILVFVGVQWRLIPIEAMRGSLSPGVKPGFTWIFIKDVFFHASMPILTYVISTIGSWILTMKSSTLSTLGEDYVMVAKARGLKESRITFSYVGRNAILPLFTSLTISLGFIVGGSVLIESIFVYKGIGWILWSSISSRDYPVMQGVFLIITISVIMANFLADLLYSRLDPRIRVSGGE
ncbi:MAG: ABC transporter permease [Dictyoglomaceae bacterium]|nr:ABC transporter permease [Dictyoglomaceae bacterium]